MSYQHRIITLIKNEIREEKITQKELANKLNITETSLSRYLNGLRGLSLLMAIKLADHFKMTLDELVGRNIDEQQDIGQTD